MRRKPLKQVDALTVARSAGYHGDNTAYTAAFLNARFSTRLLMAAAWKEGADMKAKGMPCNCYRCTAKH